MSGIKITRPNMAEVLGRTNNLLDSLQEAERTAVEAVGELYRHIADPEMHQNVNERIKLLEQGLTRTIAVYDPDFTIVAAPRGRTFGFVASAISLLRPEQPIVKYLASIPALGIEDQEFPAFSNAATISADIPADAELGSVLEVTVKAVDALGNQSRPVTKVATIEDAYIETPAITSPRHGSEVDTNGLGITVATSAFGAVNLDDAHVSSDWKICLSANGDNTLVQALRSPDLVSHTFSASELKCLEAGNTYYLFARHNGASLGSSNWSEGVAIITRQSSINAPVIAPPVDEGEDSGDGSGSTGPGDGGAGGAGSGVGNVIFNDGGVDVSTGSFSTEGSDDVHIATDWKICEDEEGTVIIAQDLDTTDLTHHVFENLDLTPGKTYWIFARFTGSVYGKSAWSIGMPFVALKASVVKPQITAPIAHDAVIFNDAGLALATNAFSTDMSSDIHQSTDWEVCEDQARTISVLVAHASTDLTAHVFANPELAENKTYYAFARHRGEKFGYSPWSDGIPFTTKKALLRAPTITAPMVNQTVTANNESLVATTNDFYVDGASDNHIASDWKICSDSAGATVIMEAVGTSDLLSHTFEDMPLTDGAIYYVFCRHKGEKFGYSPWSAGVAFRARNAFVKTPSVTEPAAGSTVTFNAGGLTIATNAFAVEHATDTHVSSDYRVAADAAGSVVLFEALNVTDLVRHTFANPALVAGQTYYAFARHRGQKFGESAWSAAVAFETQSASINKPIVTSPSANASLIYNDAGLTLATNAFSVDSGTDNHASTDWKVCSDSAGNNVVLQDAGNTSDLVSHTFINPNLSANTTYYAFARHRGQKFGYSEWSDAVPFSGKFGEVRQPSITSPSANNYVVVNDVGLTITTGDFAVTCGSDTHESTDWKITSDAAGNTVIAQANASADKTSYTFAPADLAKCKDDTAYYCFVRHCGTKFGESPWSVARVFKARVGYVVKPVITSPDTNVELRRICDDTELNNCVEKVDFTTNSFSSVHGTDTHIGTEWQYSLKIVGGASVSTSCITKAPNLTQASLLGPGSMNARQGYATIKFHLKVRHKGKKFGWSEWSDEKVWDMRHVHRSPSGRIFYGHPTAYATYMEFNDGTEKRVLLLDSAFRGRPENAWGLNGLDVPTMTNYGTNTNTNGTKYVNGGSSPITSSTSLVVTDAQLNSLWKNSKDNKTGKQNTDILKTYDSYTDKNNYSGAHAAMLARMIQNDTIMPNGCDLSNLQTLMRIYIEGDTFDALDRKIAEDPANKKYALGSMNPNGRFKIDGYDGVWSSTEASASTARAIKSNGDCSAVDKTTKLKIIPVLEC